MGSPLLGSSLPFGLDHIEGIFLVWAYGGIIAVPRPLFNVGTRVLYINHSGNVY